MTDTTPPALLPLISARRWGQVLLVYGVVWVAAGVGVMGLVLAGVETALVVALVWVLAFGVTVVLVAVQRATERREVRAGYTTLVKSHQNLYQLQPRTGRVLRTPGQPFREK